MRRSIAALIALFAASWSMDSLACDCPGHPRVVKHRAAVHHLYRHVAMHRYPGCPIALAHEIRPGCNTFYRTFIDLR